MTPSAVASSYKSIARTVGSPHHTRMPSDIFLDRVEQLERAGQLRTTDMASAAAFMDRFVTTESTFLKTPAGVQVVLHNPNGLRSVAFALPVAWLTAGAPLPPGVRRTSTDGGYAIFTVAQDVHDLDVTFTGAS